MEERVAHLATHMHNYYENYHVQDRLKELNLKTFRTQAGVPPKLKCSAAECRGLIYFGKLMSDTFLNDGNPVEQAAKVAANSLFLCYQCLSSTSVFNGDVFLAQSIAFAEQYYALYLARNNGVSWRVKPKMHLFLELCQENTQPNLFWTYKDEDFGGYVAKSVKLRGRYKNVFFFYQMHIEFL